MRIIQKLGSWVQEGEKRFGKDRSNWGFQCPNCGRDNYVSEFVKFGADESDSFKKCIGVVNKKGIDEFYPKEAPDGCTWRADRLFTTLDKGRLLITPIGEEINVFNFAKGDDLVESGN